MMGEWMMDDYGRGYLGMTELAELSGAVHGGCAGGILDVTLETMLHTTDCFAYAPRHSTGAVVAPQRGVGTRSVRVI